jgi:hypothetical protein
MQRTLEAINSICRWDCVITSFDGWNLNLSSGSSLEYASLLAVFSGVLYVSCPIEFSHPTFRLATEVERSQIAKLVALEEEDFVIAIDAETTAGLDTHTFFLVVESVALADS